MASLLVARPRLNASGPGAACVGPLGTAMPMSLSTDLPRRRLQRPAPDVETRLRASMR